ncbi:acyl-CoA N-acyltransferase [Penicillium canescens]|nr:acyl-CoA N-acyltransferase [Penicillium canescens]KAJ6081655.1 acyl-CoA N-acyltransferase [Penicillium canescens]
MSESKEVKGKAPEEATEASETVDPPFAEKKKLSGKYTKDGEGKEGTSSSGKSASSIITPKMAETLLEMNPLLKSEMEGMNKEQATEALRKMGLEEPLTSLSIGGKNQKGMASYKFWQTQPVPRFDEQEKAIEGLIKIVDPEQVSKEPDQLLDGFEWTTLDLTDEKGLQELWDLLTNHYVEDDHAMFRFRYSQSFLHWRVIASAVLLPMTV